MSPISLVGRAVPLSDIVGEVTIVGVGKGDIAIRVLDDE